MRTLSLRIRDANGFTLLELLVVVAVIATLAAMVVSQVLRARMSANEASAIASMRAINSAQQNYSQKCFGFAGDLVELKNAGNFLSPDLTASNPVAKSSYMFSLAPSAAAAAIPTPPAGCTGTQSNYYATAVPLTLGVSGTRSFASDGQGTIFYNTTAAPPTEASFPTDATIQ